MRTIKFRFWYDNGNGFKIMEHSPDIRKWMNRGLMNLIVGDFYTSDIVMQFTGLLDKNGKESFEDDICKDKWGNIFVMQWDYKLLASINDGEFEIIGNIHENR